MSVATLADAVTATLRGVRVDRHGATDLAPVDLTVRPGTLTAVVGGDGAGKTTLLQVLVGAVVPTAGTVQSPPRQRLGYVSAGPGVHRDLSVDENLRFAGAAYGLAGPALATRMDELLAVTDLAGARDRLAGQLSGGMRQKLAFACAVLHAPDLLVLDEPTTGVDPVSRAELWRLVSTAVARGTATVFSSTYVDEAERADHVVVLDRGHVLTAGPPEAIRRAVPGRVARTVGAPAEHPSWRRGRTRHAWVADGPLPAGAREVEPDLEDAVVVAALAADREGRA
jgi:ABC-2 type transport system ATP-binding protein